MDIPYANGVGRQNGVTRNERDELDFEFESLTFAEEGSAARSLEDKNLNGPSEFPDRDSVEDMRDETTQAAVDREEQELHSSRIISNSEATPSQGGPRAAADQPAQLPKVSPRDFELLNLVGQGSFGKVFQVRKRDTGRIYAMKIMRKERVIEKDHGDYVKAESQILRSVLHPYIVRLRYSFQTNAKLYLVLDFINGGHLFYQLYKSVIFTEELARLYTAEIVLAISHLHSLGYIHRDLKPENILLDAKGHVKVTDFGLAKGNMTDDVRTNSLIGTMEYIAPEIIQGQGHNKAVDWWSVGILLYEMLVGRPPFRAKGQNALQKLIIGGKLKFPPYLGSEAQHLVKSLLVRDPKKRLGYGAAGSQEVQRHPFFKRINWKKLQDVEIDSPFKPDVTNDHSVENFDSLYTKQAAEDSPPASPSRCSDESRDSAFQGFTYTEPSTLALSMANLSEV